MALEAVGAKIWKFPGAWVGVVPDPLAPAHVVSPPRSAPGTRKMLAGVGGIPGEVHPLPAPDPNTSKHGLLSLRWKGGVAVGLVVSVASYEPM